MSFRLADHFNSLHRMVKHDCNQAFLSAVQFLQHLLTSDRGSFTVTAIGYVNERMLGISRIHLIAVYAGYQWTDIASCVQWMSTFNAVLRDAGPTTIKYFDRVAKSETHTLQTHVIDSTTLVRYQITLFRLGTSSNCNSIINNIGFWRENF